jgi:hypothetical protein
MVLFPNAYIVSNCCDSVTTVTINIAGFTTTSDYVYTYTGSTYLIGGVLFKAGNCYFIQAAGNSIAFTGPSSTDFISTGAKACNLTLEDACPECSTVQQYLTFEPCCGDDPIYFQIPFGGFYEGLYEYVGTPVSGLENICYSVTLNDVGVAPINSGNYPILPAAPIFTDGVTYSVLSFDNLDCDFYIDSEECPTCIAPCYTLYNCDGEWMNTTIDLSAYIDPLIPIQIYDIDGAIPGTWYVFLNTGDCSGARNDISVDLFAPEPCVCRCFTVVTDSGVKGRYLDCDGNLQKIIVNASFCSLVVPLIESAAGPYEVVEGGNCIDGICPIKCFELTECTTGEVITSQSQSLEQYFISEEVIELVGHPGCWRVTSDDAEDCSCPVDLTVTIVHADCPTCIGVIAYKLTNCENDRDIKYTYDDLSEYILNGVGLTLLTDCGCYLVELIDFQPTSISPIVIISSFKGCPECLRPYYMLTDCNEAEATVYTYTDLSIYVGQVINIKGCDTCWQVFDTDTPINPGIVTVTNSFKFCIDCTPPLPCLCNRITNYSTTTKEYEYIDCDDESVLLTLAAGESSGKICLKRWVVDYPDTDNLEVFGDCVLGGDFCYEYNITIGSGASGKLYYKNCSGNVESRLVASQKFPYIETICGVNNQTSSDIYIVGTGTIRFEKTTICYTPTLVCPETRPKRKITPGYSVPTCDIDRYEKITCRASEILYKEVIRLRYGISNCCPEDDEKWLIKKELIDLAALVDPNYICTPVQTCGCAPSSCGCGCSSTLKTCNSQ